MDSSGNRKVVCRTIVLLFMQAITVVSMCYASSTVLVEQRLWFADISASGRYVSPTFTGNVDLKKDLGFSGANMPQTRLIWDIGKYQSIRVDYFHGQFNGAADRTERREFFGGLISREIRHHVDERLGITFWKIGWINYGKSHFDDKIRLGFLFDVKSVRLNGTVSLRSEMDGFAPITLKKQASWGITDPTIGLVIKGSPDDRLQYFIECAGLTNGKNGFLFTDYEASVQWIIDPGKDISMLAGYHAIDYTNYRKTDKSRLNDVKIAGFFYGIQKKF